MGDFTSKKLFGIPPYQRGDPLGFKEWENKLIEKEEKKQLEDEAYKKKVWEDDGRSK